MMETLHNCPLCGSEKRARFDTRRFRDRQVVNQICKGCGLVYQSPRMSEDELDAFYQAEYRRLYQGGEGPDQTDLTTQDERAGSLLGFTEEYVEKVNRHLDIGSSAGILLERFREAYGSHVVGVEPGEAYRCYAEEAGISTYPTLEALKATADEKFDLVSLAHVLEHIPDPVAYLRELRAETLTADGWLLVEVPNLFAHNSFELAHMTAFSAHTLGQTLTQAGFEVIAERKHGLPLSEIIPLYLTALARPRREQKEVDVQPERIVWWKRKLSMVTWFVVSWIRPQQAWVEEFRK